MFLLLVRHAIAEDRVTFARSGAEDRERPLSAEGRKKMRRVAAALRDLVQDADLLAASPLRRSLQTAQMLAAAFDLAPVPCPALAPDEPAEEFLRWLRSQRSARSVIAVGHEPGLSQLAAFALSGRRQPFFSLKKAGACYLEFPKQWRSGGATLHWLLAPAQLRGLAND
ncbi:MAG: histidine phosphatase family protein [Acidobacteriota bacterium]